MEHTPSMMEKGVTRTSTSASRTPEEAQPESPRVTFEVPQSSAHLPAGQRLAEVVQRVMKKHREPQLPRHGSEGCTMPPESNSAGAEARTTSTDEVTDSMGALPAQGLGAASTMQTKRQNEADNISGAQSDQPRYTSSDIDYEKKYAPDAYGEELSENARVWSVYNDEAQIADGEMIKGLNGTLDVLLVFAGLFSAVVTTFVVQSSQALSPDYAQITASLVYELVLIQRATTSSTLPDVPVSALSFGSRTTQTTDLWVTGLWLTSLTFALLTALVAVLAKQWIQHYNSLSGGSHRNRAHLRQYRFNSFERWKVRAIVGFLPVLLTVALLLFFAGLVVYVLPMDITISLVIIGFTGGIFLAYSVMTALPVFVTHCAYKTPLADYMITVGCYVIFYVLIFPFQPAQLLCDFVYESIRAKAMQWWELQQLAELCRLAWYVDPSWTVQDREASGILVRRKSEVLTTDVLDWLILSPLNASATRVAVQASSALKLDSDTQKIWTYSRRSHDYLQALDRDYTNFTLTSKHTAIAERLARVAIHRGYDYMLYADGVWSLDLWERLYMHRDQIVSAAHRALLCLVLWIRFCDDERPLSNPSAMRRASDACSLLDISLTVPKLHPVIWRELDRLARTCLLLCKKHCSPKGRDESGDHPADAVYAEIVGAEHHGQYRPLYDNFDPHESTAITLDEYCEGRKWVDGREEFLDNLGKVKHVLSELLTRLENEEQTITKDTKNATKPENRHLPDIVLGQLRRESLDGHSRQDARVVADGESGQLDFGIVDISVRAAVDVPDEHTEGHEATDAQPDPVVVDDRGLLCARTSRTTQVPASVSVDAPDASADAPDVGQDASQASQKSGKCGQAWPRPTAPTFRNQCYHPQPTW